MDRSNLYATDEDVILRAPGDYTVLCPKDQRLAHGMDGRFLPTDRWTLQSDSVNFEESGVARGCVIQLTKPTSEYKSGGDTFAVESVSHNSLCLRRKGESPGNGKPPAPVGGLLGVEFQILTLGPQLALACDDLDRRMGITPPRAVQSPEELREPAVLGTLYRLYLDASRDAGDGRGSQDAFAAKARLVKQELDDLLARLTVHRRHDSGASSGLITRFHTRLSR